MRDAQELDSLLRAQEKFLPSVRLSPGGVARTSKNADYLNELSNECSARNRNLVIKTFHAFDEEQASC